jgi:hypothetical protein
MNHARGQPFLGLLFLYEQFDKVSETHLFDCGTRTIRVRHIPGVALGRQTPVPLQTGGIADQTLSLSRNVHSSRVDSPKLAKANNKQTLSQLFAQQAKDLSQLFAQLAKDLHVLVLAGAEYGGQKQQLERLIGRAQGMKRVIWSLGSQRVSAAEEKRRLKRDTNGAPTLVKPAAVSRGTAAVGKPSNGRAERVLETVVTGLEFAG